MAILGSWTNTLNSSTMKSFSIDVIPD